VKDKKEQVEQFSPLVVAAGDQTLLLSILLAFLGNVRLATVMGTVSTERFA